MYVCGCIVKSDLIAFSVRSCVAAKCCALLLFWGSEAFFLRNVLSLGEVGLGSLLGRILCRVVLLLVRVEFYPN